jgi:SET domain-containing protein
MSSPPARIELGASPGRGRGVFARATIAAGETIETAPVIVLPNAHYVLIEDTVLYNYMFGWGPERIDGALALGWGSLYNHSYAPNARYVRHMDAGRLDFVALRDIAAGEEITVNYNGEPDNMTPVWFDLAPT